MAERAEELANFQEKLYARIDELEAQNQQLREQAERVRAYADHLDAEAAEAEQLRAALIADEPDWHPQRDPEIPRLESIARSQRATARRIRAALDGEPDSKETTS
jgi:predicted ribosome quality control (RQC) complex YloA/Tae2 family protein